MRSTAHDNGVHDPDIGPVHQLRGGMGQGTVVESITEMVMDPLWPLTQSAVPGLRGMIVNVKIHVDVLPVKNGRSIEICHRAVHSFVHFNVSHS